VAYSFREAQKPGGPFAGRLAPVSAVSAQDGGTVSVTMNRAVWNAAALFDFPIVRESTDAVPPGTGPYRMTFSPGGGYLLPWESWWQDKPHPVGRIELVDAGSADTLVYSFQYGYISMMPADLWDTFSPGIHTGYDKTVIPSGLMQYIGINTRRGPLDRRELRLALALALDRRGAVAAVYGEDAEAAVLPVPPSSPFYTEDAAMRYRFDRGEAARIVSEQRTPPELDFLVGAENTARVQMAEFCASSLRDAGFTVNVKALSHPEFEAALVSGDFDLYYAEARLAPNFDPREFLLPGGAFAYGAGDTYAMRSALGALAASAPYTDAGKAALGEVWELLHEELPILTVCWRNTLFISQRGLLSGQTPTFYNPFAGFMDWEVSER
jgi:peptide/nickel transport system substrate-binding protein